MDSQSRSLANTNTGQRSQSHLELTRELAAGVKGFPHITALYLVPLGVSWHFRIFKLSHVFDPKKLARTGRKKNPCLQTSCGYPDMMMTPEAWRLGTATSTYVANSNPFSWIGVRFLVEYLVNAGVNRVFAFYHDNQVDGESTSGVSTASVTQLKLGCLKVHLCEPRYAIVGSGTRLFAGLPRIAASLTLSSTLLCSKENTVC